MNALVRGGGWVAVIAFALLSFGCVRVQRLYVTSDGEVLGGQQLKIETDALDPGEDGVLTARWHGTGDWSSPELPGHLMLATQRREEGSSSTWVRTVPLKDISGFPSGDDDDDAQGPIRLTIARPAGVLRFEGERRGRNASGTMWLEPDAAAGKGLEEAFGQAPTPEQWVALILDDVSTDYLREVREIDSTATVDEAIRVHRHGIRTVHLRGMREAIPGVTLDEVIRLDRYGITVDYVRRLREGGYAPAPDDVIKLNRYGISPDYAKAARANGYGESVDQVVQLNRYSISPAYMEGFRAGGYSFSADDLVKLNRYSITPQYARAAREAGYDLSADDLVKLNRYNITPRYLALLHTPDRANLSVDEVIALSRKNIDEETIRKLRGD